MKKLLMPLGALAVLHAAPALADPFPGADLQAGRELHAENCVACHARQFGGDDGSDIYTRFERRITTADGLAQQITACTTQLNLALFPEDELNIAGYLNTHYYKFK
ncbi:cytochrome c [Thauera sp. CAU 1555]|uniref:Cytochrome c n=1 Tax=Thauera sedimentorum TaxID=2767595 RepID=A0ABR9B7V0_9RHOO|nr:cytochrome c [Thauera sedimentorum]MBC9071352.1 cytochrome c [Thauera sedimentorum]MBD8502271.1 cytochrome c [Thauera sedimentorum]